jgi:hypothetical protein
MKQFPLLIILALTLLVYSCNPPADTQNTAATAIPTSTHIPVTSTPSLTPGPETEEPTSTPFFDVTLDAIIDAVMTASPPNLYASYPSPDNKWRVEIVIHDCVQIEGLDPGLYADMHAYEQLILVEVNTGTAEILEDQYRSCEGLGAIGLDGRFWSPNSRYFYYTDAREGSPDGLCSYWEPPLLRLDVTTGTSESLGMGPVSPDRTKLATWQNTDFVVWSLDEGEIARSLALLTDAVMGQIAWSPDSKSLVYLQTEGLCFPFDKSHVVRLDFPDLQPDLLIESTNPTFNGITWDDIASINLTDEDGKAWRYIFETGELQLVP